MTGAVDSAAPREQPTTQNQCSCRFKWTKNGWVSRREWRGSKRKNGGEPIQKWQREEEEHWERENNKDGNWISFRSGRGERVGNKKKKRRDPSTSSNLLKGNGWRWVHHFASEGLGRREGKGFSLCGWVMQEALIRHVWAEVILDVSHTPAGQLVLGQV